MHRLELVKIPYFEEKILSQFKLYEINTQIKSLQKILCCNITVLLHNNDWRLLCRVCWFVGLASLSAIFQLYRVISCSVKTLHMPQVTDKLYHIILYIAHLACAGFKRTTLVVIGTDCIGSCKSKYHTITIYCAGSNAMLQQPANTIK